ncbi:MAG: arylesterase [Betaproteobacteria bacterium]|nr:arylesterase [Betaproteobacteria bacterium]
MNRSTGFRVYRSLRALAVLALATLLLSACGGGPKLPKLGSGDTVLAFGDSLTFGTGASEAESYPAVLAQLIERPVIRSGVPGEVTAQGLERLPAALDEHQPKLVILCLGGNDLLHKVDPRDTAANLRAMIGLVKGRGIPLVLVGVPKPGLFADPPRYYADLAKEFGLPYEGKIVKDVLYSNELKSDPIHPNARGYRRMAEAIAELLKKAGAV